MAISRRDPATMLADGRRWAEQIAKQGRTVANIAEANNIRPVTVRESIERARHADEIARLSANPPPRQANELPPHLRCNFRRAEWSYPDDAILYETRLGREEIRIGDEAARRRESGS